MTQARYRPPSLLTRGRILEAALALFNQKGFDAVSVRDIAAEARVNGAVIYYYFSSKEDLYRTLVEAEAAPLAAAINAVAAGAGGPASRVAALVEAFLQYFAERSPVRGLVLRAFMGMDGLVRDGAAAAAEARLHEELRRALEDGVRSGAFRSVPSDLCAASIVGVASSFAWGWVLGGKPNVRTALRQVSDHYVRGLAP